VCGALVDNPEARPDNFPVLIFSKPDITPKRSLIAITWTRDGIWNLINLEGPNSVADQEASIRAFSI